MPAALQPFMADRSFTNYLSAGDLDACLMQRYNTPTLAEYRAFVKQNAATVMADLNGPMCRSMLQ